ncbi:MAG TPA: CoA-binding protein [Nanoarchaeota archaeon]|nr:CoA-binding protein [Nanoarchaeota archaeon]
MYKNLMIEKFFNPKSIAVIGASRTPGKVGYAILENLKKSFSGKIYPINPFATEILGLKAYSSLKDIPEKVDLAIIAVKAEIVKEALKDCGEKGVKNVIIISSGFKEAGNVKEEEEIKKIAKKYGIRIIGPNCIGVFDAYTGIDTLFSEQKRVKKPRKGYVGFISQSGALGLMLIDTYAELGVGLSKFVSLGNKADVDEIELLKFFGKDPSIRVVSMYLESVSNGKAFMKIAKEVVKKKPVVCLKAGRTEKGKKAVLSHTGSIAGSYEVYKAVFKQCGIIEANDIEELIDFTKVLACQPTLKGNRIAIVTNGGGCGIIASDQAEAENMKLAEFEKSTLKKIKQILPPYAVASNPVDLTGDANSERYKAVLEAVFKDRNVDGVCIICLTQLAPLDENIINVLEECKFYAKPFVVCIGGSKYSVEIAKHLEMQGIPVYPTPHRAIKALRVLYEYGNVLKRIKKE